MIVPNRELANTQFPFDISLTSNPQVYLDTLNMEDNIDMGPPRGRSQVNSKNNSRDLSIISITSSKSYHKHMEIQNYNQSWCNQVEDEYNAHSSGTNVEETNISNGLITSNHSKGKQCKFNEVLALNNILPPPVTNIANNQYVPNSQQFKVPLNYNIKGSSEPNT